MRPSPFVGAQFVLPESLILARESNMFCDLVVHEGVGKVEANIVVIGYGTPQTEGEDVPHGGDLLEKLGTKTRYCAWIRSFK